MGLSIPVNSQVQHPLPQRILPHFYWGMIPLHELYRGIDVSGSWQHNGGGRRVGGLLGQSLMYFPCMLCFMQYMYRFIFGCIVVGPHHAVFYDRV